MINPCNLFWTFIWKIIYFLLLLNSNIKADLFNLQHIHPVEFALPNGDRISLTIQVLVISHWYMCTVYVCYICHMGLLDFHSWFNWNHSGQLEKPNFLKLYEICLWNFEIDLWISICFVKMIKYTFLQWFHLNSDWSAYNLHFWSLTWSD